MKRLQGWETSDGKTFDTRKDAEKHEAELELRGWFDEVLTRMPGEPALDALTESAVQDAKLLKKLLAPFAPVARPRAKKTEPAPAPKNGKVKAAA